MNRWDGYGELHHSGILGMRWGRRRWQNEDGSLTEAGRAHYGYGSARESNRHSEKMSDNQYKSSKVAERVNRDNAKKAVDLRRLDLDKIKASDALNRQKDKTALEKERLKYADKRESEKAKLAQLKEKRKLEALKLKAKDREAKRENTAEYKIAKMQEQTDREAMRRENANIKRQQDYDFTYDWGTSGYQYRLERGQQKVNNLLNKPKGLGSTVLSSAVGAAATVAGTALAMTLIKKYGGSHP